MTSPKAETKLDILNNIRNQLIFRFFESRSSGIIRSDDFYLQKTEAQIMKLKESIKPFGSEGFISYYSALGLLFDAKGEHVNAENYYTKAMELKPVSIEHFNNYNNILMKNSSFEKVEEIITEYLAGGNINPNSLMILYCTGLRNLDFRLFKEAYELVHNKDLFSENNKRNLEGLHYLSNQLELLPEDLAAIGIDKDTFSNFFDILRAFQSENLHEQLNIRFSIENSDDQYLLVEVYADISVKEALHLTSKIEDRLVKHSIQTDRKDILSKFLVYYKTYDMLDDDSDPHADLYLGMNNELVI